MANNIMNIMSVSFNSQAELEDFLNRVKGKDDDGEKDFSLQSVVPMPESLQIVSPCDRMLAWAAVNKYGIDPEKYPENVRKAICRETFLLHRKEKLTASDICCIMLRTRRKVWKQLTNTCMHCIAKQRVCSKARQGHRSTKHL